MKISIIGCGWLGLPLAQHFLSKGHQVKGSTTTREKLPKMEKAGIEAHFLKMGDVNLAVPGKLVQADFVVVNIPPGRNKFEKPYADRLKPLFEALKADSKVLFISSTGVFTDQEGTLDEEDTPDYENPRSMALLKAEKVFNETVEQGSILRFAGLLDNDRNMAVSLQKKGRTPDPDQRVNLIHREDCIGLIDSIAKGFAKGQVWHGVAPKHPTRRAFYAYACEKAGIPAFDFEGKGSGKQGKVVEGVKTAQALNYSYQYPDPLAMLD